MLPATTRRVERNTSSSLNEQFRHQLAENVSHYIGARRHVIGRRLAELDSEWTIERVIETEAPATIALGITLGILRSPKWFAVSAFAAGMLLLHNIQGWYPLMPLLRRLGFRSQYEIEQERSALRVLRGDHKGYHLSRTH